MTDDIAMRFQLQQVLAYRQLQAAVRAGATNTLVNAVILLVIDFWLFQNIGLDPFVLVYLALALSELMVGLWKKFWPVMEAVAVDGIILAAFGLFILGRQVLAWQGIILFPVNPISIFLGIYWLVAAKNTFRAYGSLRRAFPDRPSADILAWFNDLIYEIRHSDPTADDLALDLPTKPHWKAKLLGTTAFFAAMRGHDVLVAGPYDFGLTPEPHSEGADRIRVHLHVNDRMFKPFAIDEASWANYRKWMAQQTG